MQVQKRTPLLIVNALIASDHQAAHEPSSLTIHIQIHQPVECFYFAALVLHSGICYRKSICCLSVCNVSVPILRRLNFSAMCLSHFVP